MPTYEYNCKTCGETIELFQSFSEKPLRKHADCGGELKKVFHVRGVVFKGSGFYATDSRSSPNGSSSSSSSDSTGKSTKKKKKSESKAPAGSSSSPSD